jgi:ribosomal protein S18 acetylase RimI-like enzyme
VFSVALWQKKIKMIKEIVTQSELITSVDILRKSFGTVAEEFNLTKENCPTNAAFITIDKLKELKGKGIVFFGLFLQKRQIGFVALEKAGTDLFYLEKLAVLPEYRHNGYGEKLMDFCFDYAKNHNLKRISIAIIDEHSILKRWYIKYGFNISRIKKFDHLPFTVCFMEKKVS